MSQHVNFSQINYGQQVNQSQLRKSQHKVIKNKVKEEGLKASLLVMLLVTLRGRSSDEFKFLPSFNV